MDTANMIITIIQQLGFPITVSCLAFWYIKYREDRNDEKLSEMQSLYENEQKETRSIHREETRELTLAIQNNTAVIRELLIKLGDDGK